ncbi:MAG: N-acetylglucosamine-6-phosphate deacetylase [bacterium]
MRTIIKNGFVIHGSEIRQADVLLENDRILAVDGEGNGADIIDDAAGAFVAPGFIDIHVHGGGGHDFMEATIEAFAAITQHHLAHGATSQCPSAVSAPLPDLVRFLSAYHDAMASGRITARLVGAHLEGPYLSKQKAGAHDSRFLKNPEPSEYENLISNYPIIRRVTAAPELPGALALGDYLVSRGVNASIGHSDAYGEEVTAAASHGFTSVTHLYNAMSSVGEHNGKKAAGVAEMALLDDRLFVELIADLHHVPAALIRLAYRNKGKEKLILVSDCLSPAGREDGRYRLGSAAHGIDVDVCGAAYVAGTKKLAGSIVSVDTLLQNALSIGIPLVDAVWMLTRTPARLLGIDDRLGALDPGKAADIVVFDASGHIQKVYCQGIRVK